MTVSANCRSIISIHAPARGATRHNVLHPSWHMISIHAPARGATSHFERMNLSGSISIHAPARGATYAVSFLSALLKRFQSTLPRGERHEQDRFTIPCTIISIHAPARGATYKRFRQGGDKNISIHAPARGATCKSLILTPTFFISIHAPARGATSILSKIHPMFLTISHNASSFSSFPFHSFLPHLLNSSTFCALFQVRISRAFSVYYRFAPKKSTPDL